MMKKGSDLGLDPISPKNKAGNEYISERLQRVNRILYKYNKRFLSPSSIDRMIKVLTEVGIELISADKRYVAKATEIQAAIRPMIRALKQYKLDFQWDKECIQRTINYAVRTLCDAKRDNSFYNKERIKELAQMVNEVRNDYIYPSKMKDQLNTKAFNGFYDEVMQEWQRSAFQPDD